MSNIVKLQSQTLPSLPISPDSIPAPIKEGLQELYAAFADAGRKEDIDKAFTMKGYLRAIVGEDSRIVLWCLEHLILHNPRNPFRPTAQDLHELIKKQNTRVADDVLRRYLGYSGGWYRGPGKSRDVDPDLPFEVTASMEQEILRARLPFASFDSGFTKEDIDRIPRAAWLTGGYEKACEQVHWADECRRRREQEDEANEKRRMEKGNWR